MTLDIITTGLIIAGITLIFVVLSFFLGPRPWARRERVKIKTSGVNYKMKNSEKLMFQISDLEVQRKGEKDIRYLTKILLKLDKNTYDELEELIDFDERSMILLDDRVPIPKYKPTHIVWPQYEHKIKSISDWDRAKEEIQNKLRQVTFEVGLVWDDLPPGLATPWTRVPRLFQHTPLG